MKERPILFSAPMIRAILDGSKTQTRRVVKYQPQWMGHDGYCYCAPNVSIFRMSEAEIPVELEQYCPYGQPSDRLWVRESFYHFTHFDKADRYDYVADTNEKPIPLGYWKYKKRPSIHMPRVASRITLEITGVRVQRLQEISERDAWAEGCEDHGDDGPSGYAVFEKLWQSINGAESWEANPFVWIIEFKKL